MNTEKTIEATKIAAMTGTLHSEQERFGPTPSYGVFVWVGIFALGVLTGPRLYPIQVLCCLASLTACVWWFVYSKSHGRQGTLRRVLGYLAFGLGSILPLSAALLVVLGRSKRESLTQTSAFFVFGICIAIGLIAGSFHLVFRGENKRTKRLCTGAFVLALVALAVSWLLP